MLRTQLWHAKGMHMGITQLVQPCLLSSTLVSCLPQKVAFVIIRHWVIVPSDHVWIHLIALLHRISVAVVQCWGLWLDPLLL